MNHWLSKNAWVATWITLALLIAAVALAASRL